MCSGEVRGLPHREETLSDMKTMVAVIGEDDLSPVKEQWPASLCILIHVLHISLHKGERERDSGRDRGRQRGKEGGHRKIKSYRRSI